MDPTRLYQIALLKVPGVGHGIIKNLISYCGSAESVFKTPVGKLMKIPGIGEITARAIHKTPPIQAAEAELQRCEKMGVSILLYTDTNYPRRLKHIYDAPSLLYYRGQADLNPAKSVSIVGTRKATDYGRRMTQQLVEALVPHQPLIVSGLAYGIDIEAHRAALNLGLPTLGVMASGVDTIYPAVHRSTAEKMVDQGGLMSENPLGAKPDAPKFPARNRIIAGMSDVVIVVEAAESGGALITARLAVDYHRDLFAVPGNLDQPQSAGCLKVIREQLAQVYTSIKDIEDAMNWQPGEQPEQTTDLNELELSEEARNLLNLLIQNPNGILIDDLSWKSQLPIHLVMSTLLELEFQGLVKALPGKRYRLEKPVRA